MGDAWRETVVAIITEFGRTARINGNFGTDHGTATVALLVGGALKGGRVIADWPGVMEARLHEKRDLKPTTDLRAVLKGLLKDHLRADERGLASAVFPGSEARGRWVGWWGEYRTPTITIACAARRKASALCQRRMHTPITVSFSQVALLP